MTVTDVIAIAEGIEANPTRGAIGASVIEVAALAVTVLDLWEVALATEKLIKSETLKEATLIADAITGRLGELREPKTEEAISS